MRLITEIELAGRSDVELAVLFQMVSQALAAAKPGAARGHHQPAEHQQRARKASLPPRGVGDLIPGIAAVLGQGRRLNSATVRAQLET